MAAEFEIANLRLRINAIDFESAVGFLCQTFQTFLPEPWEMQNAARTGKVAANPYFELSMICCAFLIADSSGALSFFRMSIAFCAEAMASFLLPSFA